MTQRQQRFVEAYATCWNGTQAAIAAGYASAGASTEAYRLLRKAQIRAALAERVEQLTAAAEVSGARVLLERKRLAFSDIRKCFDGGNLKPLHELDDDTAAAVASVDVVTRSLGEGEVEYVHRIKLWDKGSALDALAKRTGVDRPESQQVPEEGIRRVIFEYDQPEAPSNKTGV